MQISFQKIRKQGYSSENLLYTGHAQVEDPSITLIRYDDNSYERKKIKDLAHLKEISEQPGIKWINVDGIHDVEVIESIGMQFGIHFLVMEDIVDVNQRPKMEDYENHVYIVLKMMYLDQTEEKIISEQISFLLFQNVLISFQERKGDVFDTIRNKIMNNKGRIRKLGSDYLMYSLIDAVVDNYFIILEDIGEEIADIEKEILRNPTSELLQDIYNLKMDIIFLRKSVFPLREVILKLVKEEIDLIDDSIEPYARDLYDHVIQVLESIKTYSDMVAGILDIYMSSTTNKMNEVMKVLTVMSSIFIPLTFIVGVYGMNYDSMPEISTKYGYWAVMGAMLVIGIAMILFFRKKKWL